MEYLAKWGNKGFLVNPSKVVPLLSLKTGFARKADTNEDTSGTPPTNTRGLELQTITLETRYLAGLGVDPRDQIEDWKKQFGKRYPLYVNGRQFGPDLLELDKVDITDVVLDNRGKFIRVDLMVTLVEYVPPTTTVSSKQATASGSGTKAGALAATATAADKSSKKTTTTRT